MALIHDNRRHARRPRIPHLEQLALHAAVLALALTVALVAIAG